MPQIFFKKVMVVRDRADFENASYVIHKRYSKDKMSPVCHNFVQNAWKKDFCSNCFKSREEHIKNDRATEVIKTTATLLQNKNTYYTKSTPSILKIHPKTKNKRNVRFPEEVCSVIGYGGDDWSDGEEFELSQDDEEDDTFPDTEEERELHRITKNNTDFNTVKANLLGDSNSKSYTSLLLGKKQTDSDGKKKTLMVSVTPFGQENKGPSIKSHVRKPAVINLSETSADDSSYKTSIILSTCVKESETIISSEGVNTSGSICTEKSLLEEISETLQQNRITHANDLNLTPNDKPMIVEGKMKESMSDEFDKKEMTETKKNSLVRKSPLPKTQERPKVNLSRSEFKFCKINIDNSSVDSALETLNSTANNSLASDDESFSGRTDSDNDDSGHFSEPNKCEETVKIKVFNEGDKNIKLSPLGQSRKTDGQAGSGYSTFQAPVIDMPPIIPKQPDNLFSAEASRELAGEPDGRADPDEPTEAPALPKSPIPVMDPRPSFLHGMIADLTPTKPAVPEKPKLPIKPMMKTTKKNIMPPQNSVLHSQLIKKEEEDNIIRTHCEEKNNEITEVHEDKPEPIYYAKPVLTKQDSDTSLHSLCKRKAPTPPSSPSVDEFTCSLYQRNSCGFMKSDSPVVREMEKRERATLSNAPKKQQAEETTPTVKVKKIEVTPEPAPRRNISLSHDNLLIEEKRKGKYRFSIKKLLRIGSSKDLDKKELTLPAPAKVSSKSEELYDYTPKPKPRLVIIHPLDINGSSVEVVKPNEIPDLRRLSHDDVSTYSSNSSATEGEPPKIVNKPPPPPRHSSEEHKSPSSGSKPARPPPPKCAALQKKQKQKAWAAPANKTDNIYANLGEVRSALAPRKPERTASMREREAHLEIAKRRNIIDDDKDEVDDGPQELVQATNETVINNYDDVYNSSKYEEENSDSAKNSDSDYEYVSNARSSSPECDSTIKPREQENRVDSRKCDTENNTEFSKYNNGFRSSLPYCGSETESEIYSPYSFYSSADVLESPTNDDYQNEMTPKTTTNKLRVRKGRSVVHKNLEDNYGAVVIANHEALAQVLEQVQQSATMQPSLRGLKACTNLRWNDFAIQSTPSKTFVKAGKRFFYQAVWNSSQGPVNVTLMLYKEQMASQMICQQSVQPQLSLNAITEFCDLVPLQQFGEEGEDLVQATIVVLAHAQIDTIQSYGESLNTSEALRTKEYQLVQTEQIHEAVFMMLQLINGLKCLQARGVEEIPESLSSFIALKELQPLVSHGSTLNLSSPDDRLSSLWAPKTNCYGRLCILQGLSEEINCNKTSEEEHVNSLCKCAIKALEILLPGEKLTPLLKEVLQEERAVSLNQAKSVLEFMLWGPLDVVQGVPVTERELSLQRWLDLERATVLHGLVRTRVQLNVFEQLHLMFLVRSTAKAMCDASVLLEKANVY